MSQDCIFCRIVSGDIPSRNVYEDSDVLAFLDANPLAAGHTLVIPKEHHERMDDLPSDLASDVLDVLYRFVPQVESAVDADGTTIAFNNGPAAGQEVPHIHGHIIPRFKGDGGGPIHGITGARPDLSDDELDEIASDISGGE